MAAADTELIRSHTIIMIKKTWKEFQKKTWKEFQECKLLWWVNRSLHIFGWAIVVEEQEDGTISNCYPARVAYRGFSKDAEDAGFSKDAEDAGFAALAQYLAVNAGTLLSDVVPSIKNAASEEQSEKESAMLNNLPPRIYSRKKDQ